MRRFLIPLLGLIMVTVACSPLENQARNTAAALSGSLVAAQSKYLTSCQANPSQQICGVINKGIEAQNALITATETYCGWSVSIAPPDPTAKCVPVKGAEAALNAAIANAGPFVIQLKGAL